jgi:hypothetical protein
MKYLGPTVLLLALCGWAFVGGMEFQRHRQNAKAPAPAIVASTPAPAPLKKIPMTGERAAEIAVAHMQNSSDGDNYYWGANTREIVFQEATGNWKVSLEAHAKPAGERKSGRYQNGRWKNVAPVRLTKLEVTPDGKIDETIDGTKWGIISDW